MQNQKMRMDRRKFRIGELAEELKIKKFVIRFWEKEFDLQSDRSDGGQRFYTYDDLQTFQTIKNLLYNQKFTIPGAKKQLKVFQEEKIEINPATKTEIVQAQKDSITVQTVEKQASVDKKLLEKIISFKEKLNKFKQILG